MAADMATLRQYGLNKIIRHIKMMKEIIRATAV